MSSIIKGWRQEGCIYIWKYKNLPLGRYKDYCGWHFTADDKACHSLLNLLEKMQAQEWNCEQEICITQPSVDILRVPNVPSIDISSPATVFLSFRKQDDSHWKIMQNDGGLKIGFGLKKLNELQHAVEDVLKREGDYALDDNNNDNLWIWWMNK